MSEDYSIAYLTGRMYLGSGLIKLLQQDSDPRAQDAIEVLRAQQRVVNEILVAKISEARKERGEPEPPPVIVHCKPLVLVARALR